METTTTTTSSNFPTTQTDAHVGRRPVPKPRRSLLNKDNNNANTSQNCAFQENYYGSFNMENIGNTINYLSNSMQADAYYSACETAASSSSQKPSLPPETHPPSCPIRCFPLTPPPPLPPRNAASQLPPPLKPNLAPNCTNSISLTTPDVLLNSECASDSSRFEANSIDSNLGTYLTSQNSGSDSFVSNSPASANSNAKCASNGTMNPINIYFNTTSSLSSDCSTSCSSQSSNSAESRSMLARKHSLDAFMEYNNNNNNNYLNGNSANFIGCDYKLAGESVCFSGWVRIASIPPNFLLKKELDKNRQCWAIIRHNQLSFMKNEETFNPFLGPFDLYRCIFVGRNAENRTEISIIFRDVTIPTQANSAKSVQSQWSSIKFIPEENVDYWLVFLGKCHSPQVDVVQNALDEVDVCGKLWIRQGISGAWTEGWAFVHRRVLTFWIQGTGALFFTDIRKMILVKRDMPTSDFCNFIENSTTGPILIALVGSSLYLQAEYDACTDIWYNFLNAELHNNGQVLEENRLTADNVPVIVDKCIRLVATYGLNQPGVYRRNGSAALARELLTQFREDPFNVRMKSISDESINAVADILRSFFRQLEKPLIPEHVHEALHHIAAGDDAQKADAYRAIIFDLPTVYFSTLKRLLAHLQQITAHAEKNLATVDNIAKIFGPTIFTINKGNEEVSVETYAKAARQAATTRDLLLKFDDIFQTSPEEISAKTKLDEIQEQKQNPKVRTEGFLVPIHLYEKDHKCFNVQCEWTAAQAVAFRVEKLLISSDASLADTYALFEVVKSGQLERRVSGDETLISIVLGRWLAWDNAAADCYLLLKKSPNVFQTQNVRPFADNIKFADPGSKSFKTCQLRMECGTKVVQYSKTMKQQNEWIVDEMLWFVGHESERKPPFPYTLTFFTTGGSNSGGSRDSSSSTKYGTRFAGFCVAFRDDVQREQWLNSIIVCRQEYLPTPIVQF